MSSQLWNWFAKGWTCVLHTQSTFILDFDRPKTSKDDLAKTAKTTASTVAQLLTKSTFSVTVWKPHSSRHEGQKVKTKEEKHHLTLI